MIHPGSGSQHPTNQDVSTYFSTFFFFVCIFSFYHPGVILAFSSVFCCIILVSSCIPRLEGNIPTSSWYHPTFMMRPIILFSLVSSWYHPGDRGLKCQHPGIILLRPSSRQSSLSKIEFFPELVAARQWQSCNILAYRM